MTIYRTEFDPETLQCTGRSTPSEFVSLDHVVSEIGEPPHPGRRVLTYDGFAYSDFVLNSDFPEELDDLI